MSVADRLAETVSPALTAFRKKHKYTSTELLMRVADHLSWLDEPVDPHWKPRLGLGPDSFVTEVQPGTPPSRHVQEVLYQTIRWYLADIH